MDARLVLTVNESDLATGSANSSPASVRRIAKAAKDLAIAHYASHISRLRRYSFLQDMYIDRSADGIGIVNCWTHLGSFSVWQAIVRQASHSKSK